MIALLVTGLVLFLLELVLPGGFLGVLAILSWLGALYVGLGETTEALYIVIATGVIILGGIGIIIRSIPGVMNGSWLALKFQGSTDKGYTSLTVRNDLLGCKGVAHTVLRPTGMALIQDELLEVGTEGDFYEEGTPIIVYAVQGARIIVRKM